MSTPFRITFNIDQINKINRKLPTGYKLVSVDQYKKRQAASKKKSKITYVPVQQIKKPTRRKIAPQTYYEGGQQLYDNTKVYYDAQQKSKKETNSIKFEKNAQKLNFPTPNQPPATFIPEVYQQRAPYSPKQVMEKITAHAKYYAILQFRDDFSQSNFDTIISKCQDSFYTLNNLQADMHSIFVKMYEIYPRSNPIYNDAAQLERDINKLIDAQKQRVKETQKQQALLLDDTPKNQSLVRKKTILPKPSEIKNITIKDKRILGQNIKKLAPQYLPQIVRIVFDTIQTRQQYEINIDTLPLKKLKQLQIYVNNCLMLDGFVDENVKNDAESDQSSFIIIDDFD